MNSLPPNWTTVGDQPSKPPGTNVNWIEKQTKETTNIQNGILQYIEQEYNERMDTTTENEIVKEYQEKMADLEKERDNWKTMAEEGKQKEEKTSKKWHNFKKERKQMIRKMAELEKERDDWKKMAEEVQQTNVIIAKILDEKVELVEKEKLATRRQDAMRKLLNQMEEDHKVLKANFQQQLSSHEEEMTNLTEDWERKLETATDNSKYLAKLLQLSEKNNAQLMTKQDQLMEEVAELKQRLDPEEDAHRCCAARLQLEVDINADLEEENNQLKQQLAVLKEQGAQADCKICFERPVQNVFSCGHAACDVCYERILTMDTAGLVMRPTTRCHICRKKIKPNAQKIYLT